MGETEENVQGVSKVEIAEGRQPFDHSTLFLDV